MDDPEPTSLSLTDFLRFSSEFHSTERGIVGLLLFLTLAVFRSGKLFLQIPKFFFIREGYTRANILQFMQDNTECRSNYIFLITGK
jgi:hypothetical protein